MILKIRTSRYHGVNDPSSGWIWIDGITRAQEFGLLMVPAEHPAAGVEPNPQSEDPELAVGLFTSIRDLSSAVARQWGERRSFEDELWPEIMPGHEATTATVVRLDRGPKGQTLAVLTGEAFLLSDDGKTIDRLR